jgi:RNA polymerase sigma-70 factor (ECF subfamily)
MTGDATGEELVMQAMAGDRYAFERLLVAYYDRLDQSIGRRLQRLYGPLCVVLSSEDVLQHTFTKAWRALAGFQPQGPEAFYRWLAQIARRELYSLARAELALKRDDRRRVRAGGGDAADSAAPPLVEQVAVDSETPSRVAARHEGVQALRVALAELPEHYQRVLGLRYLEGQPVAAVAAAMGCTEGAVLMLCHRAKAKLREALGSASRYLSSR